MAFQFILATVAVAQPEATEAEVLATDEGFAFQAGAVEAQVTSDGLLLANDAALGLGVIDGGDQPTVVDGGVYIDGAHEQWFFTTPHGVEHMIVTHAPDEPGEMTIAIVVDGAHPELIDENRVALRNETGFEQYRYGGLYVWDAFHRPQTAWFEVDEGRIEIHIETDAKTVGPLTVDPLLSQYHIVGGSSGSEYGSAVVTGDFDADGVLDLLVGAPTYSNGESHEGQAEIIWGGATSFGSYGPTFESNVVDAECGRAVAAADFDDDGDTDIAIGCSIDGSFTAAAGSGLNSGRGGIQIYLNSGATSSGILGSFSTTPQLTFVHSTDRFPYVTMSMIANQFGTGEVELMVTAGNGGALNQLHVYRYSSGAAPVQRLAFPSTATHTLAAMVKTPIGTPGIAVGARGQAFVYASVPATGLLSTTPTVVGPLVAGVSTTTIAVADLNLDGFDDIALGVPFSNRIDLWESTPSGYVMSSGFPFAGPSGGQLGSMIAFSDMNQDRFPDLLACDRDSTGGRGRCAVFGGAPPGVIDLSTERFVEVGTAGEGLGDIGDWSSFGVMGEVGGNDTIADLLLARPGSSRLGVFDGEAATMKPFNEITPESNTAFGGAGRSVAMGDLTGDGVDDLVVGMPGYSSGRGAVLVYFGGSSADGVADYCVRGTQVSSTGRGEQFGSAVAVAKVRGSSLAASLIVGAEEFDSSTLVDVGRVVVINGPLTSNGCSFANMVANQQISGTSFEMRMGTVVANARNAANTSGDGIVIGAPGSKSTVPSGLVVVWPSAGTAGLGSTVVAFAGSDPAINCKRFGLHVANAGNVDGGNGRDDILIGAPECDSGGFTANGKAFLVKSTTSSVALSSWSVAGVENGAGFGVVAGVGDVNNDGRADFAVGAPQEDNAGFSPTVVDAGRVRVFHGAVGTPTTTVFRSMSVSTPNSSGASIAGNIDLNRDGVADMVVGEPNSGSGGGRVRVFFGNASGTIDSTADFTLSSSGRFGAALAVGDFRNDRYGDFAAGAPSYTNVETEEGRVHVRSGAW